MKKYIHIIIIVFISIIIINYALYLFTMRIYDFSVGNSDLSIDKISWNLSNDGDYYLLLSKNMNRSNLFVNLKFNYDGASIICYDLKGKKLGKIEDSSYTDVFSNDDVIMKVKKKNRFTQSYKVHVIQSSISSLFIQVKGGDESFNDIVSSRYHTVGYKADGLLYDEDNNKSELTIKRVRGRGNSTWLRPKKPYQIKLYEDTSLLGMKDARKWVLLANHWDGSLSRNYLWYTLAKKLGLEYSVDCEPVDLYINNNYMGSYLLTNRVEVSNSSVDIGDNYLYEITNTMTYDIQLKHGYKLKVKNINFKRIDKEYGLSIKKDLTKSLNKIEKLIYDKNVSIEELGEYIDIESFVKCYWIQEISENYDVSRGSNYFYTKDGKIYMGPIWDMDDTLNRSYDYAKIDEKYILTDELLKTRILENWYNELLKKEDFSNLIDNYFIDNYDIFNSLNEELDNYHSKIKNSANMNYIKWPYDEMKSEQIREWIKDDVDFSSSMELLKKSLRGRIEFYKNVYSIE